MRYQVQRIARHEDTDLKMIIDVEWISSIEIRATGASGSLSFTFTEPHFYILKRERLTWGQYQFSSSKNCYNML